MSTKPQNFKYIGQNILFIEMLKKTVLVKAATVRFTM